MKKRTILIMLVILLLVAAGITFVVLRKNYQGTDIIGVTSLLKKNTIIMNAKTGKEFVNGSGTITVADGKQIHLEYSLKSGSFDIAFHAGDGSLDIFQDTDMDNLPAEGEVFGKSGIEGTGTADFDAPAGDYTAFFEIHDTIGTATVSVK